MNQVSQAEWVDWKNHPVTQEFYNKIKEELAHWRFMVEGMVDFTDIGNVGRVIGIIQNCQYLLNWQPEWETEDE